MKKMNTKLQLNSDTIRLLGDVELGAAQGGRLNPPTLSCPTAQTTSCVTCNVSCFSAC